jgi:glycosyltransferase involved in cell wall biosynthesis/phosphoglycolate phosphatase-like HAD superfamily hydrolase
MKKRVSMSEPLVSVLLPAYNHAPFLAACVQSVRAQTLADWELRVVDDASTDETRAVLAGLPPDTRVSVAFQTENRGVSATLNAAFAGCRGRFVAVLNSDDGFEPTRLARLVECLEAENTDLVGSDIRLVDAAGMPIAQHWWVDAFEALKRGIGERGGSRSIASGYEPEGETDWVRVLLSGNVFMTSSNFVLRRSLWTKLGGFGGGRYCQDYDFLLRALRVGARFSWVDAPLLAYRWHETNTISESPLAANREAFALLRTHLPALVGEGPLQVGRLAAVCDQLERIERYEHEIHLALKHEALREKDEGYGQQLAVKDREMAKRDGVITDRDALIQAQAEALAKSQAEKAAVLGQLEAWEAGPFRRGWRQWKGRVFGLKGDVSRTFSSEKAGVSLEKGGSGLGPLASLGETQQGWLKGVFSPLRRLCGIAGMLSPFPVRLEGFGALRSFIEGHPARLKAVSFDVFDTLVFRCIEPPEILWERVAQRLSLGVGLSCERILALRREAEAALRLEAVKEGLDHECHFDALTAAWAFGVLAALSPEERTALGAHVGYVPLVGSDPSIGSAQADPEEGLHAALCRFLEDEEMALEGLALQAKPAAGLFLAWARAQGLRVLAVSDMYLGKRHVQSLLERLGLAPAIDALYVSSELRLGKHSGRLFAHVLADQGLLPAEVVHVGDNLHSDALLPGRCGIQGVFLDEPKARAQRRSLAVLARRVPLGGIWPGRFLNAVVAKRLAHDPHALREDFFFRYGLEVLGPIFSVFMRGFIERVLACSPRAVFFLARDGALFMQMYEAYRTGGIRGAPGKAGDLERLPPATYAYASRKVVSAAAMAEGLTHEQALLALYNPKQEGLLSILKTYSLLPATFEEAARAHGLFPMEAPLTNYHDPRLLAFLADEQVQVAIRATGEKARAQLSAYFAQIGFFGEGTLALCDIGWNGTIQRFMGKAFGERADYPCVQGFYFALLNTLHAQASAPQTGTLEGLMLDGARQNPCERAAFDFEELFEQGARSLEATTVAYACDERGVIRPCLKSETAADRVAERACNPRIAALQEGVMVYWAHFGVAQHLTGLGFEALKPFALAQTERAVVYPTALEARCIGTLAHSEDFGHDHVLDISSRGLGWRGLFLGTQLRALAWRFAPFAFTPGPFGALGARCVQLWRLRGR